MSAPFEQPPRDPDEPQLSQRQMLAGYLGFDQQPPIRPSWWADLLWLVPIDLGLLCLIVMSHADQKAILIILVAVSSVIAYMTAVRVRYVNLTDRHPEHAPREFGARTSNDD